MIRERRAGRSGDQSGDAGAMLDEVLEMVDYGAGDERQSGIRRPGVHPQLAHKRCANWRRGRRERGLQFPIEIDGGITLENVADAIHAGVEWVVAGTSIFHTVNPAAAFEEMRRLAQEACASSRFRCSV